jgi:hypothetical protein
MKTRRFGCVLSAVVLLAHCGSSMAQSAHDAPPATQPNNVYDVRDLVIALSDDAAAQGRINDLKLNNIELHIAPLTPGTACLGVGVESPGEALRSQLKLPEGAGLVVNYVDDQGPSKEVVHKHDVLQKLDDQILVNSEQLVTLVRMHAPDETVSLTLIREARSVTVQVKLATKKNDEARALNFLKAAQSDDALLSVYTTAKDQGIPVLKDVPIINKLYVNRVDSEQLKSRPITFNDGDLLACIDGSGNLLAIDVKTGNVIFHGPITTEEQWKNAPQLVRDKLSAWKSLIAPQNGQN